MASEVVLPAHTPAHTHDQVICACGCAPYMAMKARLECVAQVRALLT